jgi:hypothetical protein
MEDIEAMNMVDLSELYEEPIDPAARPFTTKKGSACRGCMFQKQRIAVCNQAVALATRAGMASCDDQDIVYTLVRHDHRQLSIVEEP